MQQNDPTKLEAQPQQQIIKLCEGLVAWKTKSNESTLKTIAADKLILKRKKQWNKLRGDKN